VVRQAAVVVARGVAGDANSDPRTKATQTAFAKSLIPKFGEGDVAQKKQSYVFDPVTAPSANHSPWLL
jgi:hypothetical protein